MVNWELHYGADKLMEIQFVSLQDVESWMVQILKLNLQKLMQSLLLCGARLHRVQRVVNSL